MSRCEYRAVPSKGAGVRYHDEITGEGLAAMVTKVHAPGVPDSQVNLVIFLEDGGVDFRRHVPFGPGQFGRWGWPPFVPPASAPTIPPSRA